MPEHGGYLWAAFCELSATRGSTGFGPAPISRHDIHAWEADTFTRLDPWERQTVLAIDRAYLDAAADRVKQDKERSKGSR
jgi:hypothetical protein